MESLVNTPNYSPEVLPEKENIPALPTNEPDEQKEVSKIEKKTRISTYSIRREGVERIVKLLSQNGGLEFFSSDEKKLQYIQDFTPESFLKHLDTIYKALSGMDNEEIEKRKYGYVVKNSDSKVVYTPPNKESQREIIKQLIIPRLKEMNLNDASIFIGLCVNLLHIYPDGNGRLGRTNANLFAPGNDLTTPLGEEFFRTSIINRDNDFNCDPSLIEKEVNDIIYKDIRPENLKNKIIRFNADQISIELCKDTEEENLLKEIHQEIKEDFKDFFFGMVKYLETLHPELLTPSDSEASEVILNLSDIIRLLKTESDQKKFFAARQWIKAYRFTIFYRILTRPNMYPCPDQNFDSLQSLLIYRMMSEHFYKLKKKGSGYNFTA